VFKAYQHIERFGTDNTEGIELGVCYVFPKLDGTNSSVWSEEAEVGHIICAGSRTRQISLTKDNAGFCAFISKDTRFSPFFEAHPTWRLFGEWLVKHTLKTYREDAWRKFYVFDVYDDELEQYLPYDIYNPEVERFGIEVIPPLCKISDPTPAQLQRELEKNTYLIQDGMGAGEGITIKNYDYKNKWGQQTWAKLVRNEFKEKNAETFGVREVEGKKLTEKAIAEKYVTQDFVDKTRAKIEVLLREAEGKVDRSKMIPQLLGRCYHDLVAEECWNFVKEHRNPTIDFKKLQAHVYHLVKIRAGDLF
jgi:hypothetical protein